MSKVVTFGEIMLRLNPPGFQRFSQAASFEASYGGGEANVAVSCAAFGHEASFVTALPKNEIAENALRHLRYWGVDTRHVVRGGERIGIYFLENGASQRGSAVVYDRAHSSIAAIDPAQLDWTSILAGAQWFHTTGITPALSKNAAQAALEGMQAAKAAGARVSFDLNYRKKLWSPAQARATVEPMLKHVDLLIGNEEDAKDVLGIEAAHTDVSSGKVDHQAYRAVAEQIRDRYGVARVSITLRESESATINHWSAALLDGTSYCLSRRYSMHVVDRVGGGDSYVGGLVSALLDGRPAQDALEFAVAASCLKHSIVGDFNKVTKAEVEALMKGGGAGRVQR